MTAAGANNMLKEICQEEIFLLVYVAITYGLRKSEVLGLKWDAVDCERDTIEIKSTVVKNKSIVYKDTTKSETNHDTYELLPEMRFHDLRHSTASILFDKGWDLEAVKALLRHATLKRPAIFICT